MQYKYYKYIIETQMFLGNKIYNKNNNYFSFYIMKNSANNIILNINKILLNLRNILTFIKNILIKKGKILYFLNNQNQIINFLLNKTTRKMREIKIIASEIQCGLLTNWKTLIRKRIREFRIFREDYKKRFKIVFIRIFVKVKKEKEIRKKISYYSNMWKLCLFLIEYKMNKKFPTTCFFISHTEKESSFQKEFYKLNIPVIYIADTDKQSQNWHYLLVSNDINIYGILFFFNIIKKTNFIMKKIRLINKFIFFFKKKMNTKRKKKILRELIKKKEAYKKMKQAYKKMKQAYKKRKYSKIKIKKNKKNIKKIDLFNKKKKKMHKHNTQKKKTIYSYKKTKKKKLTRLKLKKKTKKEKKMKLNKKIKKKNKKIKKIEKTIKTINTKLKQKVKKKKNKQNTKLKKKSIKPNCIGKYKKNKKQKNKKKNFLSAKKIKNKKIHQRKDAFFKEKT